MEERVVVVNKALEEFLERLLKWDELCSQLRELYYRYLDLAAFRSEKCYFPGRKCKRSWDRQYDVGDLTLMWTYITNTAPLCGRLMKALAEVEYKIRLKALKSLEEYGGIEKRATSKNYELASVRLRRPVYAYLVLWQDRLYVVWKEFYDVPKNGDAKSLVVMHKLREIITLYKNGKKLGIEIDEYEIDREYARLWLEVPLTESVSRLLGEKTKAPVALFKNIGWLLSDDVRRQLNHATANFGQVAVRLLDWIALATYFEKLEQLNEPLIFRLSVQYINKTRKGDKPIIRIQPIGLATEKILAAYNFFGISLGKSEEVITHGYAILKALREEAVRRTGQTYVVNDVGSWIAFSLAAATLVLGDGYVAPYKLVVASKYTSGLSDALGGTPSYSTVLLQGWQIRLLLPPPSAPVFKKSVDLYRTLTNFPSSAVVEINGVQYLLTHKGNGEFVISIKKASELYNAARQLGVNASANSNTVMLTYTQLAKLAKRFPVRLLTDMERDVIKEVRTVITPNMEALKSVIDMIAKMAKITAGFMRSGRRARPTLYVKINPYDKSKLEEIVKMLKLTGIRLSVHRRHRYILIVEQRSVEAIRAVIPQIFSQLLTFCTSFVKAV